MSLEAMEIREFTDEELDEELARAKDEIARLRYRAAFEELENPSLLKTLRREIARLKTVQVERARSEENQVG
ncbi:50S ribosomal protein L29 [Candidatus Palauibacter polyketidifaciens]|uniref:50S ribosomal protein L29 n=1 Tax=Candidatus Palauibacter polyketidifaciens TaxID=3056740 RepID=UPI00139E35CA|nr:50S ribosomal protein L29 [Candidatus Palauibacter polyketidifaciens]MDE2721670.1 50S ribosomal protein L29 [Candidatus Palauibacter polyketidifaciens]MYE33232.1 50S ribosomal protein L29 [Gemmatimonadales bacterium]